MSVHNFHDEDRGSNAARTKTVTYAQTATGVYTMTRKEILATRAFIFDSTGGAITQIILPAATRDMEGLEVKICEFGGNTSKVNVAAGFGGAGASYDFATLATGEYMTVFCAETIVSAAVVYKWFVNHHTAPASS